MRGRNGTWHRYYYCRNHDPIRAGGEDRRCPERNIRADALDGFVFDQIRSALLQPDVLLAGEQAVTVTTPIPDDELLAAELARLDRKIDAADAENADDWSTSTKPGSSSSPNSNAAPPTSPPANGTCRPNKPASPSNAPR